MASEDPRDEGVVSSAATDTRGSVPPGAMRRAVIAWVVYAVVRLLLIAVIAGVLTLVDVPLLLSLLIAIVAALPLSFVLFRGLRARVARETEAATAGRRARREALRAQLRGDAPPER